jgi:RNA polymerase sigma-70 factor (ECF subfamily)
MQPARDSTGGFLAGDGMAASNLAGGRDSNDGSRLAATTLELGRLVADHHAVLFRFAYRLSGSSADAEDLTQQTYLLAQTHLDQLVDAARARAWMFAILRNCYLKQRRRRTPLSEGAAAIDLQEAPAPQAAETEFDTERLQAALNELPDDFKLILLMYYFDDCSYKQIAAELDLPMGTVMSRLSRAKGHLRAKLTGANLTGAKLTGAETIRPDETSSNALAPAAVDPTVLAPAVLAPPVTAHSRMKAPLAEHRQGSAR